MPYPEDLCHERAHEASAAGFQLLILIASALTPRVLDWRTNLAMLSPFLRKLFWVYGAFIAIVIIAFTTRTFLHAEAMAAHESVGRSLCVFVAIFWGARLFVQFVIFDPRPLLTNWFDKRGYHGLTIIFAFLIFGYGKAAI